MGEKSPSGSAPDGAEPHANGLGTDRRRPSGALLGGIAAIVVVAAIVGCRSSRDAPQEAANFDDPGLVHVHGLAVNPADSVLYAATHTGLFRVENGTASRVGDRYQDTMGFTIAGPDLFLGSGHPDLRDQELRVDGKPPHLGLIESTDRGRSWQARSLLGDADLHAITLVGDLIIGYDSTGGRVLASTDGQEWETRGEVALFDMTVDPNDPDRLAGVTEDGTLMASNDGGRTWTDETGAPVDLAVVAWGPDGLWVGDDAGGLHRKLDDGTWRLARRFAGAVEAIAPATESDLLHVAVAGVGVVASPDAGRTWTTVYSAPPR